MKFAFFGYRRWAFEILKYLIDENFEIDSFTVKSNKYPSKSKFFSQIVSQKELLSLNLRQYRALFFYGWSWLIPETMVNNYECVCLHPSPLPKYRGGSPIQHQIIEGRDNSAVTLFRMDTGIDTGPIYYQEKFSLKGDLKLILNRITKVGIKLTTNLLRDFENNSVKTTPQDETKATVYKRRTPEESELTIKKLKNMTAREIHDFIRALQDPYPNAYFKDTQGNKVYFVKSKINIE